MTPSETPKDPGPVKASTPDVDEDIPNAPLSQAKVDSDSPPSMQAALKAAKDTKAGNDEKETIDRYLAEATDFFGRPAHVIAGAMHALQQAGVQELTRAQAKAAIDAWLSAPVGVDPRNDREIV